MRKSLTRDQVDWIIDHYKSIPVHVIANHLHINRATVYKVLRRPHRGIFNAPIEERFWDRVKKTSSCWLWTGIIAPPDGYGRLAFNGEQILAHRVSWELHFGPIPKHMLICHHCDIPPCVRPSHLFLGTYSDNSKDAVIKRRVVCENARNVRLKQVQVDKIRALCATDKYSQKSIAAKFGIRQGHVSRLKNFIQWPK